MNRAHPTNVLAVSALCALAIAAGASAQSAPAVPTVDAAHASLAAIDRGLSESTAELERLDAQSRQLTEESEGLPARRAALRDRARREARRMYHLRQGAGLALRGGPGAFLEQLARLGRTRRALSSALDEFASVERRVSELATERARLDRDKASVAQRRTDLAARRQLAQLGGGELGVAPLPTSEGERVTVYGGRVGEVSSGTFAETSGRLLLPIAGRAEVRRVQREGAEGPGLEILAPLGAPARAVFAGRVAFSDRYASFGRIVIIDHGDHYYTVTANLAAAAVRVGEEVGAGAVLGTVGDEGQGPGLYFEIRHGSETIDPAPWFGLQ
jgi:murein DD-endopeptidase MepM/ murein hydrolase activator NlpD